MAFLDEEEELALPEVQDQRPRRTDPARRRQQFLVRRLIAVGAGLGILILLVLGVRGCLDARKERGLRNYTNDVSTAMAESQQIGEEFFGLLQDPGDVTPLQYESQIRTLRGTSESLLNRARKIDTPDELTEAQDAVVLTLQLRRNALGEIANNVGAALGAENRAEALTNIERQMDGLYASDVLYRDVARPEIRSVLAEEEIDAEVAPGNFMPEQSAEEWLSQARVIEALAAVSGGEDVASGTHGLGLVPGGVSLGGVVLSTDAPATVPADANELTVQVQNQGEAEETNIPVIVTIGGSESTETIPRIRPGDTAEVKISLSQTPAAGEEATVEVSVTPVPGESVTENNNATYEVVFGG